MRPQISSWNAVALIDGGPGAEPKGRLSAWLITDEHGELMRDLRKLALPRGLEPYRNSRSD